MEQDRSVNVGMQVGAIRCKFKCDSVTKMKGWQGIGPEYLYDYKFSAVMADSEENKKFWAASPSGTFQVNCVLSDAFEIGREYYFDIFPAPNTHAGPDAI